MGRSFGAGARFLSDHFAGGKGSETGSGFCGLQLARQEAQNDVDLE
jgi:hypothetical protein